MVEIGLSGVSNFTSAFLSSNLCHLEFEKKHIIVIPGKRNHLCMHFWFRPSETESDEQHKKSRLSNEYTQRKPPTNPTNQPTNRPT